LIRMIIICYFFFYFLFFFSSNFLGSFLFFYTSSEFTLSHLEAMNGDIEIVDLKEDYITFTLSNVDLRYLWHAWGLQMIFQ